MFQRRACRRQFATVMLSMLLASNAPGGEEKPQEDGDARSEVWDGIMSSFALPFEDLFQQPGAAGVDQLTLRIAFDYPLQAGTAQPPGRGSQGARPVSPTLDVGLNYSPLPAWFAAITAYRYVHPSQQQIWNPDFTYSFGYDDWHPYTLSLVYSNFGGNRFRPDAARGESRTRFDQGSWSLGFKFPLPQVLEPVFTTGQGDTVGCISSVNFALHYSDAASASTKSGKHTLVLGCRYTIAQWWFLNTTLYIYPQRDQQQPWDPDFTYGFGYFDWHPGTISIQYNNYSGNRLPGRKPAPQTGQFRNGALSLSWSHTW